METYTRRSLNERKRQKKWHFYQSNRTRKSSVSHEICTVNPFKKQKKNTHTHHNQMFTFSIYDKRKFTSNFMCFRSFPLFSALRCYNLLGTWLCISPFPEGKKQHKKKIEVQKNWIKQRFYYYQTSLAIHSII